MALIYLVRHGEAAASFTDDIDPGLSPLGQQQAASTCRELVAQSPLTLLSSPLQRALETAAPLAEMLGQSVGIETRLSEIPSPGLSLSARGPWLRQVMAGKWHQQTQALRSWRAQVGQALLAIEHDTAVFSHYVAINTALAIAEQSDDVWLFAPDNASVTVLETDGEQLTVLRRGKEARTRIN